MVVAAAASFVVAVVVLPASEEVVVEGVYCKQVVGLAAADDQVACDATDNAAMHHCGAASDPTLVRLPRRVPFEEE